MLLVVFTLLTLLLEAVSANFRFINPPHLDVSVDGDVPGRNDVYLYSSTLNIEWSLPSTPDSMMTLLLAWLPRDIPKGFYKSSNWMFGT